MEQGETVCFGQDLLRSDTQKTRWALVSKDFSVFDKLFQKSGPLIDIPNLPFLSGGQEWSNSILKN